MPKKINKLDKKFWLTLIKWSLAAFLAGYLVGFLLPTTVLLK
ncbi:hypothetical protein [Bacillus pumilus]|nr:hypothetical protein [Bacillus pumilus]